MSNSKISPTKDQPVLVTPAEMIERARSLVPKLREITGSEAAVEIEVLSHDPGPQQTDMGLFDTLTTVLEESCP